MSSNSNNILETLSGLWTLNSINRLKTTSPSTSTRSPSLTFGPSPNGTILYHPSGYMSVIITSTTPPSPEQIMPALSYSGPYKVSVTSEASGETTGVLGRGRVAHGPLIASISPEIIPLGMVLERDFVISKEEGGMVLRLSLEVDGKDKEELEWRKVKHVAS